MASWLERPVPTRARRRGDRPSAGSPLDPAPRSSTTRAADGFTAAPALTGVDVRQVLAPGVLHGFLDLPASIEPVDAALDLMAGVVLGTEQRRAAAA